MQTLPIYFSAILQILTSYQTYRVGIRSPRESHSVLAGRSTHQVVLSPDRRNGVRAFDPPRTLARADAPPLRFLLIAYTLPLPSAAAPKVNLQHCDRTGDIGLAPDSSSADFPTSRSPLRSVPTPVPEEEVTTTRAQRWSPLWKLAGPSLRVTSEPP
jgi:hypothetical protein